MTNQSTIDKLIEMRLTAMADAFRIQMDDPTMKEVPFEDRFGMLVNIEYSNRKNNRLKRLIRQAEFEQPDASITAIDYQSGRKLNKALISRLATCEYITEYRNIFMPLIFSFREVNMKLWTDKNQKAKTEKGQEMKEIQYKIVKEIAVLSASDSGYTKEINLISWNGREPKYDIRSFSPNREKCGKGITLNADEAAALLEALQKELHSGD